MANSQCKEMTILKLAKRHLTTARVYIKHVSSVSTIVMIEIPPVFLDIHRCHFNHQKTHAQTDDTNLPLQLCFSRPNFVQIWT
jgi:hypothetical protein